jgi:hypothetical protein
MPWVVDEPASVAIIHGQSRQLWGTEYHVAQEEADRLVSEVQARGANAQSLVQRIVERARLRRLPQLLPMSD